jgi:hypothetical protein
MYAFIFFYSGVAALTAVFAGKSWVPVFVCADNLWAEASTASNDMHTANCFIILVLLMPDSRVRRDQFSCRSASRV